MTDHANEIQVIRGALKQATAEHLRHHRLLPEWAAPAEAALDALLAGHAAEVESLRDVVEQLQQERDVFEESADFWEKQTSDSNAKWTQAERERDEARAENERQRIRYGSFLDWAIEFVVVAVEADEEVGRPWLDRMEHRLREERVALAAAQEPPAECPDCGLDLEPGEKHGQAEGVGCVAQEPPAKGDDRDE